MSFLHPALAWAAVGAVALPIVIHLLFRRRRVPVDWAAMELLREAIRRTNRRLRFEQWIVLVLRALAVLAAGLAIAVPMFGDAVFNESREKTWVVVLDNSATSALTVGTESELARLRGEVLATVERSRATGDRFAIVSAAAEPSLILAPTADFAEFERVLDRIESTETPSDLAGAVSLARETFVDVGDTASRVRRILVASSFRRGTLREGETLGSDSPDALVPDTTRGDSESQLISADSVSDLTPIEYLAVAPAVELPTDVRIDRIETRALPSGGAFLVRAVISREGLNLDAAETRVRVKGESMNTTAPRVVQWDAGQSESTVEFQVVPRDRVDREGVNDDNGRRREIVVSIDDDVLSVGNTAYAVIDIRQEIEVAVIGRRTSLDGADLEKVPGSLWIARALMPGLGVKNGIRVREMDPASCDSRALLGVDVVLASRPDLLSPSACDAIGAFVRDGGVAVLVPNGESLAQTWGPTVFTRLGVSMRVGPEARDFETPLLLRDEQPSSSLLASIAPELPALCAPIEVRRAVTLEGVTGAEAILVFADGTPFVVAQSPVHGELDTSGQSAMSSGVVENVESKSSMERGLVVCLAASPELSWTNLPVKPMMVPLFQEIVRTGIELAHASDEVAVGDSLRTGSKGVFRLSDTARTSSALEIGDDGVSRTVIPASGIWKSDEGALIAANIRPSSLVLAPNARESVRAAFLPLGSVRIAETSAERSNGVGTARTNVSGEQTLESDVMSSSDVSSRASTASWSGFWPLSLFILALTFLLAEGVLSRIFSHASLARAGGRDGGISTVGSVRARTPALSRSSQSSSTARAGVGGLK